jgi:hypothetical protein
MPEGVGARAGGEAAAEALLEHLWRDYVAITPQAERIHALLRARGERFRNDHVALRGFDVAPIGLEALERPFLELGWERAGAYDFPDKHLAGRGYLHPGGRLPRVFLSELRTGECSPRLRAAVREIAARVPRGLAPSQVLTRSPSWPPVEAALYEELLAESEYAAWVAAFGIRANHFTVHANDLVTFTSLRELNRFLEAQGFRLNGEGDKVQGSPAVLLEQSSTLADRVPVTFAGGVVREIPSCYYEFARRYPDPRTGQLFQGFVAASANVIFESTDARRRRDRARGDA